MSSFPARDVNETLPVPSSSHARGRPSVRGRPSPPGSRGRVISFDGQLRGHPLGGGQSNRSRGCNQRSQNKGHVIGGAPSHSV